MDFFAHYKRPIPLTREYLDLIYAEPKSGDVSAYFDKFYKAGRYINKKSKNISLK